MSSDAPAFAEGTEVTASATTFEAPLVNDNNVPELNRSVTLCEMRVFLRFFFCHSHSTLFLL